MRARAAVLLAALAAPGCRGVIERIPAGRTLPFVVRCEEIQLSPAASREGESAVTPAVFSDTQLLTQELASALDAAGIFTQVVTENDAALAPHLVLEPDLVLEIEVNRYDFGPGTAPLPGAVYSTLAWMFGGAASWLIEDREYPDSEISLRVVLREPSPGDGSRVAQRAPPVFEDNLFLRGLRLTFAERSAVGDWFWNLLIPPWLSAGDPTNAGRSLVQRSPEFFAGAEPQRILSSFPALYLGRALCYLGYDPERGELILVSKADVDRVGIACAGTKPRVLGEDELGRLEARGAERDEPWRWLTERAVGLGIEASDQYFRIPLEPGEAGYVRIEALIEGSTRPARWTVYRERAEGHRR